MASPSFAGADLFDWGGHVPHTLQLLHPGVVLLGHGIWEHAVTIHSDCGTNPWLILRWMDLDINNPDHTPEKAADFICAKAKALMALGIYCVAYGLNEQHTNRERARAWELKFIERCHWHGVPTVCSNYSYANFDNDEAKDFKDVWLESDYNGPHRYDLYLGNGQFSPRLETSLRYRKWKDYPIEKDLCTEFGIEDGGWQQLDGLTAGFVQERMLENVWLWKNDGALAATYFCMTHINLLKWGPYYALDSMYKFWGDNAPAFEPGGNVPIPKELDAAMEMCLEGQREYNRALAIAPAGMRATGELLDTTPRRYGDIYNLLALAKKALSQTS